MKIYALVTHQGTAALETALYGDEFTEKIKAKIESMAADDIDLTAGWKDVSDNEAFWEEVDVETRLEEALAFIERLLENTPTEAVDLLTNEGEDLVERLRYGLE
jgi:hypothetical protein